MHRRGFTVLELLCALGVLAVLLSIALPRVSAILPALLLDQAASRLAADLALSRVKAINRNTRVRTIVELAPAAYRVEVESEGRFESEGDTRPFPPRIDVDRSASTRISGGAISITFQPRGNTSDNATIALTTGGGSKRVVVGTNGRVRIQ